MAEHVDKLDKELQQYKDAIELPKTYNEGFNASSIIGTLFVAFIMIPGTLYMELIAGMGVGGAAQWVTVLLFVEIIKRMNRKLNRAQIFILFYMAGAIVAQRVNGTPLFRQFLVRSEAALATGISAMVPDWVAPKDPAAYVDRSFFQKAWLPAIGLIAFRMVISRINNLILGFGLFKAVSDVEKLPFPMAGIGAQGVKTIADDFEDRKDEKQSMRWRIFSIGGAIGMVWGFLYMGLPILTGAILNKTMSVFPIPFVDLTFYTKDILPAVATGFSFNLGQMIIGMVMPFWAMVGSFVGLIITMVANPILYKYEILKSWLPGDSTVETMFSNNVDLYFSITIGVSLALATMGILKIFKLKKRKIRDVDFEEEERRIKSRGTLSNKLIITIFIISTALYIIVSGILVEWHKGVMLVLIFIGFVYTPVISYVTARLEGLAGQVVEIPFIREIAFILSRYEGVGVWFLPIAQPNLGRITVMYKQSEIAGTKISSVFKANIFLFPIIIFSMIVFSNFIWSIAEVPSHLYPYAQEIWEFRAKNACLVYSATIGEYSQFYEALNGFRVLAGYGLGMFFYIVLSFLNAPILLVYGVVRGINQTLPHVVIPQFIGALLSRFYFSKKYGRQFWLKHVPVISAGYMCGSGLIATFCIGIVFLAKSATTLPF